VVQHGLRVGMLLFITSEVMFFFAFFWAFFHSNVPAINRIAHEVWPPEGIVPFETWGLPFLNTLILLSSGATLTIAHHAIRHHDRKKTVFWTLITVILGVLFTTFQAYEYGHAAFGFTDGIYSSTFYMATGFHGFHVIVGTLFLLVCFFRARSDHFTPDQHVGFEAAAWYWHFVDVVWLFLFVCVYWWGSSGFQGVAH
jgi:cytochrome c oxidase subunit 3